MRELYKRKSHHHPSFIHSFTNSKVKLSGSKEVIDSMDAVSRAMPMSIYEDFNPSFEWVEGEGFKVLAVNLPGFNKEQIKVQVDSDSRLRILGDGSSRRRSRFTETFEIPEGCKVNDIRAKFENETLQVRFPVKQRDVPVYEPTPKPAATLPQPDRTPKPAATLPQLESTPKPAATVPQPESSQKRVNGQPAESADARPEQKVTERVKSQAKEEKSSKPAEEQKPQAKNKAADELVQKANGEATGSGKLQEKLQDKGEVAAKVDEVANGVKETENTASAMLAPGSGGGQYMASYGVGSLLTGLKKEKKVLLVNLAVASLVSIVLGLYLKYKN